MEEIASGQTDIYAELGVAPGATLQEITGEYRKMALLYHPDKNSSDSAKDKFQRFSLIYSVLRDPRLRSEYDNVRSIAKQSGANLSDHTRRFREQLQRAEQKVEREENKSKSDLVRLEQLRADGLRRRREFQRGREEKSGYISFRDLDVPHLLHRIGPVVPGQSSRAVVVKWKHKEGFDGAVLAEIMSKFGPVSNVSDMESGNRYHRGRVEFERTESALQAVDHDYKKSAVLWDGSRVRKLASLLRGCEMEKRAKNDKFRDCATGDYADKVFEELQGIQGSVEGR